MLYVLVTIAFGVGVALGAIMSNIYRLAKTSNGTLKVVTDDPDGLYLFLELSKKDLAEIEDKKQVILEVKKISQK